MNISKTLADTAKVTISD